MSIIRIILGWDVAEDGTPWPPAPATTPAPETQQSTGTVPVDLIEELPYVVALQAERPGEVPVEPTPKKPASFQGSIF